MTMPAPPAPDPGGQPPAAPAAPPAAPPAQAPTAPTPPAPAAQPPAPVPQPPTWMPPAQQAPADDAEDLARLPQKWQKHIRDLRDESAKYRTSARAETVLRHAYTTAAEHGVNPAALLGSTVFAEQAKNLDPNASDFPAKLAETIQQALTTNPWMAAQAAAPTPPPLPPTPAVSGGEFAGAPGEGQPITEEQLSRMNDEQIAKAYAEGKLKHLM